jgi:hypothetical protein
MAGSSRGEATFLDSGTIIATREVDVRWKQFGDRHRVVSGRLLGGRRAAADLVGRRLQCVVASVTADPLPCVVRTDGQIHFLPVDPADPSGVREPRRPVPQH